jgi:hypothetical protein
MERAHPRSRTCAAITGAVILAFLASGCSGTGSGTGAGTRAVKRPGPPSALRSGQTHPAKPPPGAARFIARADEVCGSLNKALAVGKNGAQADVGLRNAASERATAERLMKLKPPAALARDWGRMNEYRLELAQQLTRLNGDAQRGAKRDLNTLATAKLRLHARLFALAIRDGFKDCATVGLSLGTPASVGAAGPPAPSSAK